MPMAPIQTSVAPNPNLAAQQMAAQQAQAQARLMAAQQAVPVAARGGAPVAPRVTPQTLRTLQAMRFMGRRRGLQAPGAPPAPAPQMPVPARPGPTTLPQSLTRPQIPSGRLV